MTEIQQKCINEAIAIGDALYEAAVKMSTSKRGSSEPAEIGAVMAGLATIYAAQRIPTAEGR